MNIMNVLLIILFVLTPISQALRCRSGNQHINDEVEKVMIKCRHHNSESGKYDYDLSSADESSDDESSSDEGLFTREFFTTNKNSQSSTNKSGGILSSRRNGQKSYRQQDTMPYSYQTPFNYTRIRELNPYEMSNNPGNDEFKIKKMQYDNQGADTDNYYGKSCSAQCFFEELNCVNRKGFPEISPVTRMMLRGIQDPILRDFIEQSILECFGFLNSEINTNKCIFSQHLMNCLADKGQEHCEDWHD